MAAITPATSTVHSQSHRAKEVNQPPQSDLIAHSTRVSHSMRVNTLTSGRRLIGGEPPWRRALLQEALSEGKDADGTPKRLRRVADKCFKMALEGDLGAIKEIADRLDGKAPQAIDITGISGADPETLGRTQLLAMLIQVATQAGLITPAIDVTPAVQTSEPGNSSETPSDPVQT